MVIDILAGLLSGSKYGSEVVTFHQLMGPTGVGVFTLAIDIGRFMDRRQFQSLVQSYFTTIKASKKANGVSRIYLPGEIEFEKEKVSLKEGIEIGEGVLKNINLLLEKTQSSISL
jgi:LDH2 family malate/lactate/ureidoglycolate dehydrogenase